MGRTLRRRKQRNKRRNPCSDNDYILFIHWLISKGWKQATKLKLRHFSETGRGFMAMNSINSGDVIVRIPKELVITAKNVEESWIGNIFISRNIKVPIHLVLTTFLLYEKHLGDLSYWYRYILMLPEFYTSPLFSTSHELKDFPSFICDRVENMRMSVNLMFETLLNLMESQKCVHCNILFSELFGFDAFLWAWFTVNSRVVYISPSENFNHSIPLSDDNSIGLVPYLDMLNHSNNSRITANFSLERGYELKSLVNYKKFDQVFIHYGSHDNLKLFLEYGFIIPNNNNDTVPITIDNIVNVIGSTVSVKKKLSNDLLQSFLKNLYCSNEGLSWNCKALIYLLLAESVSVKISLQNVYTSAFSSEELAAVDRIEKSIISQKIEEVRKIITKLPNTENCVLSIGKCLFHVYLKVLNEAIIV